MKQTKLDTGWQVYRDKDAFSLVYTVPADAKRVTLPYDAMFHEPQQPNGVSGGRTSYLEGGVYHYYKELFVPAEARGHRLLLHCDGVFSKSFVYCNGSQVGEGSFGYVAYDCDLTDYLHYGSTNRLLIVAKTEPLSSRWYSGGGVCRGVWLYEGGAVHVAPGSFCLVTTAVEPEGIAFRLKAVLQSLDTAAREVRLCLTLAKNGETCLQRELTVHVKGGGTFTLDRQFYLPGGMAWSDAEPALYDAALSVWDGDTLLDSETQRTGFCLLRWDARHGLRVNGRSVKLRGACLHHDEGLLGGVSTVDYEYRRVRRLKAAGFNAVRSAHNHAAPALLAACDALGVYVLDEVCDMWTKMKGYEDYTQYFSSNWKQTVTAMVAEDRTHPCVVGYSTGNEISDICTDKGIETSHEMYLLFRQLDPSRFVTNGINGAFAAGDGLAQIAADLTGQPPQTFADGDVNRFLALMATHMPDIVRHPVVSGILERLTPTMDVLGYNYMTERYLADAERYPDRIMLGTETYPRQIAENWRAILQTPAVLGDFTWTGWDYMGELSAPCPAWNNPAGDLDSLGNRRPVSYYREIVYGLRTRPYLCVRPPEKYGTPRQFGPWIFTDAEESWSFAGAQGQTVTVEVYAPDGPVTLFLNGQEVARGTVQNNFALFDVVYQHGELRAECAGGCFSLHTAGPAHHLTAAVEAPCMPLGEGLWFVNVGIADADGRPLAGSGQTLQMETDGADFVAFASLGQQHQSGFTVPEIVFAGWTALAVVQKTAPAARVRFNIRGLPPLTVTL